MGRIDELIARLPDRHKVALKWFAGKMGSEQPWPGALPDGTLLVNKAKGIYKPNWTKYALSIRQSLGGPYPDYEPEVHVDGTWSYLYFQENRNPLERDSEYTNVGLVACMNNRVPVGVIRQIKEKPNPRYRILGVALVTGWQEGYFFLEGFSASGLAREPSPRPQIEMLIQSQQKAADVDGFFSPRDVTDGRQRILASIVRRRGQPEFRRALLKAYDGKCSITGCDAEDALEAAHILPYRGAETNRIPNGLLLRADIHILFDMGLIAVDISNMTLLVSPDLEPTEYNLLAGKHLRLPANPRLAPSIEALKQHRSWSGL